MREAGGDELVERLLHLDAVRGQRRRAATSGASGSRTTRPAAPDRGARADYDVVLAGGGLSLLLAPLLADRGLRVAVFDRARVGGAHREWNAGERELRRARARPGSSRAPRSTSLVVATYAHGVCRWHGGGSYPVTGVLDHAFDAGAACSPRPARAPSSAASRCSMATRCSKRSPVPTRSRCSSRKEAAQRRAR